MPDKDEKSEEKETEGTEEESKETKEDAGDDEKDDSGFDGEFDEKRAKRTITAIREERNKARKEAQAIKKRLKELEDANKSDEEKQAEELKRLRAENAELAMIRRDRAIEKAVLKEAPGLNIADVSLALTALDPSDIEFDDDGNPQGVSDALEALVERHPTLVADEKSKPKVSKRTNAKAGSNDKGDGPKLTADEIEAAKEFGMTPEQYAVFKNSKKMGADTLERVATGKTEE